MNWTAEHDAILISRKDALNARDIAALIGTTRNSVLGRLYRLGLSKTTVAKKPPPLPDGLVSLADLAPDGCRWPEGDPKEPGFGFCGQPVVAGARFQFCPDHMRRAFKKTSGEKQKFFLPRIGTVK